MISASKNSPPIFHLPSPKKLFNSPSIPQNCWNLFSPPLTPSSIEGRGGEGRVETDICCALFQKVSPHLSFMQSCHKSWKFVNLSKFKNVQTKWMFSCHLFLLHLFVTKCKMSHHTKFPYLHPEVLFRMENKQLVPAKATITWRLKKKEKKKLYIISAHRNCAVPCNFFIVVVFFGLIF